MIETRTIPLVKGDGVGPEVTGAMVRVVDAAVEKAYSGQKKIEWKEVLAGGKAFEQFGTYLPDETAYAGYGDWNPTWENAQAWVECERDEDGCYYDVEQRPRLTAGEAARAFVQQCAG